jgi:hypothetical protein
MNANLYVTKDYENETAFRPKKTNPNKPNLVRRRRIPERPKSLAKKSSHTPFDFQSLKRYDGYRLANIIAAVSL